MTSISRDIARRIADYGKPVTQLPSTDWAPGIKEEARTRGLPLGDKTFYLPGSTGQVVPTQWKAFFYEGNGTPAMMDLTMWRNSLDILGGFSLPTRLESREYGFSGTPTTFNCVTVGLDGRDVSSVPLAAAIGSGNVTKSYHNMLEIIEASHIFRAPAPKREKLIPKL